MMKTETRRAPTAPFSHLIHLGVDLVKRMVGMETRGAPTTPLTAFINLDINLELTSPISSTLESIW
jgi:hypothetical protein